MNIKIELQENRMGDLEIDPVNQRILRKCKQKIIEHHREGSPEMHRGWQEERTVKWLLDQSCVYVQKDTDIQDVYDDLRLSKGERESLSRGWPLVKMVPIDLFDHWFLAFNRMPDEYFLS